MTDAQRRAKARKREADRHAAELGIEPTHPVVWLGLAMLAVNALTLLFFAT